MTNTTSAKLTYNNDYKSLACFKAIIREEILPNTNRKTTDIDVLKEALKRYQTDLMNANTIKYLYELIGLNFNFKQDEITQVEGYSVWENKALKQLIKDLTETK